MRTLLALATTAMLATGATFAPALAADQYKLDPSHSQILFSYDHLGFSTTYGLISGFDGNVTIDPDDLSNSSVKLEMTLEDVMSTGWKDRDVHFLSADFFNIAENPIVTFTSTKVEATGDQTAKITGELSIAGQTQEVVLDAKLNKMGEHPISKKEWAGFDATTTVKRSDFGVEKFAPYVSDEVEVKISVELEKTGSV